MYLEEIVAAISPTMKFLFRHLPLKPVGSFAAERSAGCPHATIETLPKPRLVAMLYTASTGRTNDFFVSMAQYRLAHLRVRT